jgi:hypothetical protein
MRALATGLDLTIDNALEFGVFDSAQREGKARRGAGAYLVSPCQQRRRGNGCQRAPPARSSRREWGRRGGARPIVAARNQERGETAEGNEVVRDSEPCNATGQPQQARAGPEVVAPAGAATGGGRGRRWPRRWERRPGAGAAGGRGSRDGRDRGRRNQGRERETRERDGITGVRKVREEIRSSRGLR